MTKNRLVCVDLFSGLGGFSESPIQRGWEVVRIDNDDGFVHIPNTRIDDVMTIDYRDLPQEPDLLLLSPPCQCFSLMAVSTYWKNGRPNHPKTHFAIKLVKESLRLKDELKPKYWVLENPNGMLVRVLGPPMVRTWWAAWGTPYLKPTNLWGIIPSIDFPSKPKDYIRAPSGSKLGIQDSSLSAAERSLIPFKFSEALAVAVENNEGGQTSLEDFAC